MGPPREANLQDLEPDYGGGSPESNFDLWAQKRIEDHERRIVALEGLLTPEQHAQLRLIKQAEHVIEVAKTEGQL